MSESRKSLTAGESCQISSYCPRSIGIQVCFAPFGVKRLFEKSLNILYSPSGPQKLGYRVQISLNASVQSCIRPPGPPMLGGDCQNSRSFPPNLGGLGGRVQQGV